MADGTEIVASAGHRWRYFDSKGGGDGMHGGGGREGSGGAEKPAEQGEQEEGGNDAAELSLDLSDCSDEVCRWYAVQRGTLYSRWVRIWLGVHHSKGYSAPVYDSRISAQWVPIGSTNANSFSCPTGKITNPLSVSKLLP